MMRLIVMQFHAILRTRLTISFCVFTAKTSASCASNPVTVLMVCMENCITFWTYFEHKLPEPQTCLWHRLLTCPHFSSSCVHACYMPRTFHHPVCMPVTCPALFIILCACLLHAPHFSSSCVHVCYMPRNFHHPVCMPVTCPALFIIMCACLLHAPHFSSSCVHACYMPRTFYHTVCMPVTCPAFFIILCACLLHARTFHHPVCMPVTCPLYTDRENDNVSI
jgi:hypothetical protein